MSGFSVKVYRTYFLESDIHDGDYPRDDTHEDEYEGMHAVDVVRLCVQYGLTFAYGSEWAWQVDGTQTTNYATGELVEISLHLGDDCPERVANAIRQAV